MTMLSQLIPHPATPPSQPFKLWVDASFSGAFGAQATCSLFFSVDAPVGRFAFPPLTEPERQDGLWKSTCFEAFVQEAGENAYREYNFTPGGNWAAYDFTDRREGMAEAELDHAPDIRFEDNMTWFTLGARFTVDSGRHWRLGLTAVIEEADGTKSYWALKHGADAPDFHDPSCFVATLG